MLHAAPLLDAVCLVTIDGAAVVCDAELRTELASIAAPAKKKACRAAWAELLPLPPGGAVPLIRERSERRLAERAAPSGASGASGA